MSQNHKNMLHNKFFVPVGALVVSLLLSVSAQGNIYKPKGVIVQVLGTSINYGSVSRSQAIKNISEIAGHGFTLSWDASPVGWRYDILNRPKLLKYLSFVATQLHNHGLGVSFGLKWKVLLPQKDHNKAAFAKLSQAGMLGVTLNPKTGAFETKTQWNFGNPKAREEFARKLKKLFDLITPENGPQVNMFYIDEIALGKPGPHSNSRRISTYWTSPTYSKQALVSFRKYLAALHYPGASTAKFPVTTKFVPPSKNANAGLPAVPITKINYGRLAKDNNWPNSPLWKAWYAWRQQLYTKWVDTATTVAANKYGNGTQWLGCMVSSPVWWFVLERGVDLDQIAALPHVQYLVAGYWSGMRYSKVKQAALRHGKRWGGMVELCHYGHSQGVAPDTISREFKAQIQAGASTMLVYAGTNFLTSRSKANLPADSPWLKDGRHYMPAQIKAWRDCIQWLENSTHYSLYKIPALTANHFAKGQNHG